MANVLDYYEYFLLYVDDCLVVSQHPEDTLMRLGKYFPLKPESIGLPKLYLTGKLSQIGLQIGVLAWSISASKYIQQALNNPELVLNSYGLKLRRAKKSPLPDNYHPECDTSPECGPENARLYKTMQNKTLNI